MRRRQKERIGARIDIPDIHGRHGATSPRLVTVEGGDETVLPLPEELEVHEVSWTADGRHFAAARFGSATVRGRPPEYTHLA